jgi:50S ribosomal protein L16 3-hydroxylase
MTWSVGFRAPTAQELGTQFLGYLQEHLRLQGMYADPDLKPQRQPAEISPQMVDKVEQMLRAIRWDKGDIADFLGAYLTEPKPYIVFARPRRMSLPKFAERFASSGVRLDLKSLMLTHAGKVFINGETFAVAAPLQPALRQLADSRALPPLQDGQQPELVELLWQWHLAGYLQFGT